MVINPQYLIIAEDIAKKIKNGQYRENSIIKGRTVLSAEYSVSPETIRKAIHILEKDKIVTVKHGVGIIVTSAENAAIFLKKFDRDEAQKEQLQTLHTLIHNRDQLNKQITETLEYMTRGGKLDNGQKLEFEEITIRPDCWAINSTLGDIYFYNYTEATVVAVRRNNKLITSPGPEFTLIAGDTLIIICKDNLSYQRALTYLIYGIEDN